MKKLKTLVENKRLGLKGVIVGFIHEPSFFVEDENGKEWSGGIYSQFYEEWEEVK